jgi:hypothetical protein
MWLGRRGKKEIARQLSVDVKTVRRYLKVVAECGLQQVLGPEALTDEFTASLMEKLAPNGGRARGEGWSLCERSLDRRPSPGGDAKTSVALVDRDRPSVSEDRCPLRHRRARATSGIAQRLDSPGAAVEARAQIAIRPEELCRRRPVEDLERGRILLEARVDLAAIEPGSSAPRLSRIQHRYGRASLCEMKRSGKASIASAHDGDVQAPRLVERGGWEGRAPPSPPKVVSAHG